MTYEEWSKLNPGRGIIAYIQENQEAGVSSYFGVITEQDLNELIETLMKEPPPQMIDFCHVCRKCGEPRGAYTKCKC
jgi:hypothetical protein